MSSLVVVESPAKARTLERILGSGYNVLASYGHIRDLPHGADQIPAKLKKEPWARLGVDVENDFKPLYIVPRDSSKHIKALKAALKNADELLLATDEDREGESISWHVVQALDPKVPVRRIVFHEITDEAIHQAIEQPREIDLNLVRAQESRRIIDRLFGYQLSPLLWKKVKPKLSAGRVQSVAVRLCVMRERERRAFHPAVYWDAEAEFEKDGTRFTARLVRFGDQPLVRGKDFDADTGKLKGGAKALWLESEDEIEQLIASWQSPWTVTSVAQKPYTRKPYPPFTTSSLQQEAYRKLRFSARHTMRVAQRLYEGIDMGDGDRTGLITYMRTDSLHLSQKALKDAQTVILERYGEAFTTGPREYKTTAKGAQEAHEAIRPTEMSRMPRHVKDLLTADELRLYDLIWKRAVASQMSDARLKRTTAEITATPADQTEGRQDAVFSASGKTVEFAGFLRAYVEGSDDPRQLETDQEILLPPLDQGEACDPLAVQSKYHETSPPARYTEASLVKKLEAEGIGRPSTYASILDTILRRGYVFKKNGSLVPTFTAYAVTKLLEAHFEHYVDIAFTALLEQDLDEIAAGEMAWKELLELFYFGDGEEERGLEGQIAEQEPLIEYPAIEIGLHPESGEKVIVRIGRYGPYLQQRSNGDERISASIPEDIAPADLTLEEAVSLLEKAKRGAILIGHTEDGEDVYLNHGRFGAYVQIGETPARGSKEPKPRRASVPKETPDEEVTIELALKWLSLPKVLGTHPDTEAEVIAADGRYGPYIRCGDETRSLPAEDDIYTVALDRALEVLAQPKRGRQRGKASRKVLREFEAGGKKVELLDGFYGPYLTNGDLNAGVPKGTNIAELTAEEALRILAERGKPPKRKRKK
jgi:DNA topoisomerase-1